MKTAQIVNSAQETYDRELQTRLAEWKSGTLEPHFGLSQMVPLLVLTVLAPAAGLVLGWFL